MFFFYLLFSAKVSAEARKVIATGDREKIRQYLRKKLEESEKEGRGEKRKIVVTSNRPSKSTAIRELRTKPRVRKPKPKEQQLLPQGN